MGGPEEQCTFNDSFSPCTDNIQFRIPEDELHVEISKVQDILRQKILKRPDRQFLIEHHILKDTNVAPSLQVYEQSLKKARLADNLNDKLLKRPGPLELVEYNILETDPAVKEVIKDGLIPYEKTSSSCEHDGLSPYMHFLKESRDSSESLLSDPVGPWSNCQQGNTTGDSTKYDHHRTDLQYCCPPPKSPFMWWEDWAFQGAGKDAGQATVQAPHCPLNSESDSLSRNIKKRRNGLATGGGRGSGRSKSALIFHEYQGPSTLNGRSKHFSRDEQSDDVVECGSASKRTVLDTYKVLLHQQQIFLELLHDLRLSEDVAASMVKEQEKFRKQQMHCWRSSSNNVSPNCYGSLCSASDRSTDFNQSLDALSQLRVSDLRDECRQRGLFVSGTKQDLIKRISRHDALQINEAFMAGKMTGVPSNSNSIGDFDAETDQNLKKDDIFVAAGNDTDSIRLKAAASVTVDQPVENPTRNLPQVGGQPPPAAPPCMSNNAGKSNITRTIQDLNFAELFAAVDAASSSGGGWATDFDDLFTGKQMSTKPLL